MGGKVSPGIELNDDSVSINVSRQQAKDLIVALTHALQSGGGKSGKEQMLAAGKSGAQAGKNA